MLVRFTVSNFLSFNEEVELSMVPGLSRQHPDHILRDERWNGINLLRSAVIYGANASGKSNLVKAMHFAQNLIVKGTRPKQPISVDFHALHQGCGKLPSKFEFEFRCNEKFYAYGFELDRRIIHTEWLYEVTKKKQTMLFERETHKDKVEVNFGNLGATREEMQFLGYVAQGTRPNQLFLTESLEKNVAFFEDVFSWFSDVLKIIFPHSRFLGLEISISEGDELSTALLDYLQLFNTGISGLELKSINISNDLPGLPDDVKAKLIAKLEPGKSILVMLNSGKDIRYVFRINEKQEEEVFQLMTKHNMAGCDEETLFEIAKESDGTQRLLDLIPALYQLVNTDKVYVIDELDRSLHPHLSYKILEHFLSNAAQQQSQLIVTTHESHLLDLDLLRRDEIWFIEKNQEGASTLYSLEEFTPRYDKDIRKGYLLGRFGAIPMIGNVTHLGWARK